MAATTALCRTSRTRNAGTESDIDGVAPAPSRDAGSGIAAVWCDYEMPMFMGNGIRSSTAREYPCPTE